MSVDDLEAEARSLELGVGAARLDAAAEYEASSTDAVVRRDEAARLRASAEAGRAEADRQVVAKQAVADRIAPSRRRSPPRRLGRATPGT